MMTPRLVSRLRSLVAFGSRCIPAGGVVPPSNTPGILGRRALPAGRIATLGVKQGFGDETLRVAGALLVVTVLAPVLHGQTDRGPYARIAVLHPHDGRTVDFEAGYVRHLDFHRQAKDHWTWYGWTVWAGERQRWFVYASFGHSAASLDAPVSPADDERDNVANVTPHARFAGNAIYEYLPALSRGTGSPSPASRVEFTTVDLTPGSAAAFEAALGAQQSRLAGETLWYRMVAGGPAPRYVRLRPRPNLATLLDGPGEGALPETTTPLLARVTVEILNLRPTMSYGLPPSGR
jgi:hypothetical protein